MAVEILPSVLATTAAQLRQRLAVARHVAKKIHLDVMDGKFVATRSVSVKQLSKVVPPAWTEMHFMVERPEQWLSLVLRWHVKRVILHVELREKLLTYIPLFRSQRMQVVLAINPATPIGQLDRWISSVHGIHVMTVKPGRNGATFQPKMIARVRALHKKYPRAVLSADGGVNPETARRLIAAGAKRLVVGSYVHTAEDPMEAWGQLKTSHRAGKRR